MSQSQILDILKRNNRPMLRSEVERFCDENKESVCRKLNRLAHSGFVDVIYGRTCHDVRYEYKDKTCRAGKVPDLVR